MRFKLSQHELLSTHWTLARYLSRSKDAATITLFKSYLYRQP